MKIKPIKKPYVSQTEVGKSWHVLPDMDVATNCILARLIMRCLHLHVKESIHVVIHCNLIISSPYYICPYTNVHLETSFLLLNLEPCELSQRGVYLIPYETITLVPEITVRNSYSLKPRQGTLQA